MRAFVSPRLWLFIWLGLGAAGLLYVILSAALSGNEKRAPATVAAPLNDQELIAGEMANFVYAASLRSAPTESFERTGGSASLAEFRGKAVLVNFWATWCPPCLKELPALDALKAALGGADFDVLAIAADPKGLTEARVFLEKLGVAQLDAYADPTLGLAIAAGVSAGLPVSILYDAEGREVGRLVGDADWSSPEAMALIRATISSTGRG